MTEVPVQEVGDTMNCNKRTEDNVTGASRKGPVRLLGTGSLLAVVCIVAVVSCIEKSTQSGPLFNPTAVNIEMTPEFGSGNKTEIRDRTAENMALWLSGEFYAPNDLYLKVKAARDMLREYIDDSLRTGFMPPVRYSELLVKFTDSVYNLVKQGAYDAWNDLNKMYGVDTIEYSYSAHLYFRGVCNPAVIAHLYSELPGVMYSEPNFIAGDWPNTYPWILGHKVTFLIRQAWGDCPSGCIYSRFIYYRVSEAEVEFVGAFDMDYSSPPPNWWYEARVAYYAYRNWGPQ
jgi:hypothetical protein